MLKTNNISTLELFDKLEETNHIKNKNSLLEAAEAYNSQHNDGFLLKILMFIGVIIGASLLGSFILIVITSNIHDIKTIHAICFITSIAGIFGAILLQKQAKNSTVITQISFILMAVCKVILVLDFLDTFELFSFYYLDKNMWISVVFVSVLTGIIYPFYNIWFDRFASCFISLLLINYFVFENSHFYIAKHIDILAYFLIFANIAGILYLALSDKLIGKSTAFLYSLITSFIFLISSLVFYYDEPRFDYGYFLILKENIVYTIVVVMFLFLIYKIAGSFKNLVKIPFVLTILTILATSYFINLDIMFSVFLIILGAYCQKPSIKYIGFAYLPISLISYYYFLDITLIEKGYSLIISGLILLLGRVVMKKLNFDGSIKDKSTKKVTKNA